jgi:lipopolysaccharide transport system ATP-binding protein
MKLKSSIFIFISGEERKKSTLEIFIVRQKFSCIFRRIHRKLTENKNILFEIYSRIPMNPIIRVENLSKRYSIGDLRKSHTTLSEHLLDFAGSALKSLKRNGSDEKNHIWALRDVNFQVGEGEVLGFIGRNGAGKSTLLKIISRITKPTRGRIELFGRVGSLLEVGTGFHPELTGRENIFLNGTILGMKYREVARKFDEIVAFAEIEKFLDTPVKHYSSGMYMRLAFAVAAHLEPEILIIDEVLSVGDTKFQKKCLGKMEEITHEGRTVLFVSHDMAVVRQLCDKAILLDRGKICGAGSTAEVLSQYIKMNEEFVSEKVISEYGIELRDIQLKDLQTDEMTTSPIFNQRYELNVEIKAHQPLTDAALYFRIYDELGILVSSVCTFEEGVEPFLLEGTMKVSFPLPKIQLFPGTYNVSLIVCRYNDKDYFNAERCFSFEVQSAVVNDAAWAYNKADGLVRISDGCKVSAIS